MMGRLPEYVVYRSQVTTRTDQIHQRPPAGHPARRAPASPSTKVASPKERNAVYSRVATLHTPRSQATTRHSHSMVTGNNTVVHVPPPPIDAAIGGWFHPTLGWSKLHARAHMLAVAAKNNSAAPKAPKHFWPVVESDVDARFELDVVIPFFLTGVNSVRRMHSLNKYIRPQPRRIFVLAATIHTCQYLTRTSREPVKNLHCLPAQALSGWSIPEMRAAYGNLSESGRAGWFLQQFAKLFVALADIGLSEDFLIMDSDNLMLQPLTVVHNITVHVRHLAHEPRPGSSQRMHAHAHATATAARTQHMCAEIRFAFVLLCVAAMRLVF